MTKKTTHPRHTASPVPIVVGTLIDNAEGHTVIVTRLSLTLIVTTEGRYCAFTGEPFGKKVPGQLLFLTARNA